MSASTDHLIEPVAAEAVLTPVPTVRLPRLVGRFRSSSVSLWVGSTILGLLVAASVVSKFWTPYPPIATGTGALSAGPSAEHWFGTDRVGADVFSRTISAGWTDVMYTVAVVALALVVGSVWGALAGFYGRWLEAVTLRLLEILQAFPSLLLALFIISVVGPGTRNVILVAALIPLPDYVRLARAEVLSKKNWQFAEAARMVGNRPIAVLFKHVMPNSLRPLIAYASISAAWVVGNIAALGYVGLGIQPDAVEWGSMIARGQSDVVSGAWWESFFPGMGILILAIGFQLLGDGLAAKGETR